MTIPQKFFIERSIEILYRGTIDSYRVRARNPKSILEELKNTISAFERKQLKHFISITATAQSKFALRDEALDFITLQPNYLKFVTFSAEFFQVQLKQLTENNFKQVKNCVEIILNENVSYLTEVLNGLKVLLGQNPPPGNDLFELLKNLDTTLTILFTELLEVGFSKGFLYRYLFAAFVNNFTAAGDFDVEFDLFRDRVTVVPGTYQIVFKLDTTPEVIQGIQAIGNGVQLLNDLAQFNHLVGNAEFDRFSTPHANRRFILCDIVAQDYLGALKIAKGLLAENLDVLNLGFSDQTINVHSRVLVIDAGNINDAQFQVTTNFLDGKYKVAREHYEQFIVKLPALNANTFIFPETKEKIKSAIRYLRLGNESTEVEHKFINYWIGLEYLFSNYESSDTINRIKGYFVACHSLSYVKRNAFDFHKNVSKLPPLELALITQYDEDPLVCLVNPNFYIQISSILLQERPLIAYRASQLGSVLAPVTGNHLIKKYVEKHQKNSLIHFTRIYRLRNEIVHDAATNTNNESIAANLRYYLTFILNGVIDFLSVVDSRHKGIEDYFTLNEIYLANLSHNGWGLMDSLCVTTPIDFIH
ncbi:hypothetical protein [Pedobacter gandavensis]|uniref:hypothetical protein n=1 Tax=Pedobacter gandavensis TaxID=2679963 RepID=UPI00292EBED6|nr:hypothetical protein [Pedobacter gandavensis]